MTTFRPLRSRGSWIAILALVLIGSASIAEGASDSTPSKLTYTPWARVCAAALVAMSGEKCVTVRSGRGDAGQNVIAAILIEPKGGGTKILRVALPLGTILAGGVRVAVDADAGTQTIQFMTCLSPGCIADVEVTAELFERLKKGQILTIQAIDARKQPVTFAIPLDDFARVLAGRPAALAKLDEQTRTVLVSRSDLGSLVGTPELIYSPWTKFCLKGQAANATEVCFTGKDVRVASMQVVAAAVIVEPKSEPRKILRITLALGAKLADGVRIALDGGATPQVARYVICFANGCLADFDATPDLIGMIRRSNNLVVRATTMDEQPISLPLPLYDFAEIYDGPPLDPKEFEARQKKLQEELRSRQ